MAPTRLALLLLALGPALACGRGETRHDVFMRGLQAEGEAERGPCRLVWDPASQNHVIDGDQVQACLAAQQRAQQIYEQAAALGHDGEEFERVRARAEERVRHLEIMLKNVRRMELDQDLRRGAKAGG